MTERTMEPVESPKVELAAKEVLESLDREIYYYRSRLTWLFTYVLGTQALLVTGTKTVPLLPPLVGSIVYTASFFLIAIIATVFRNSYVRRIYYLRSQRNELIKAAGYSIFYDAGGIMAGSKRGLSPSALFLVAVWCFSCLGALTAWLS